MIEHDNAQIVRRLYESAFDPAVIGEVVDESCVYTGPGVFVRGRDRLREMAEALRRGFPDLRFRIEDLRTVGHDVHVAWSMEGTHLGPIAGCPPTHRRVVMTGRHTERLKDGRIVERSGGSDYAELMRLITAGTPRSA